MVVQRQVSATKGENVWQVRQAINNSRQAQATGQGRQAGQAARWGECGQNVKSRPVQQRGSVCARRQEGVGQWECRQTAGRACSSSNGAGWWW